MIQAKEDHESIKKGEEGQMMLTSKFYYLKSKSHEEIQKIFELVITNIPNDRTSDY